MVFLDRNVTFNTPSFCCSLSRRTNLLLAYDFFRFLKRPLLGARSRNGKNRTLSLGLLNELPVKPEEQVIDVGCGTGWFTHRLAVLSSLCVTVLDTKVKNGKKLILI